MATGSDKNIGIDVTARDKTKKALGSVKKNLKGTSKEANTLSARFRNMARATAAIEGPLGGTAGRLSVIATLLGSANVGMVALTATMTGMTLVAGLGIKRFGEFEEQGLKVEQMLKTTGNASGLTARQINTLADEIGEATLQSRNGVLEASAVLMSFKSIAGDSFRSTMKVAADMSALMGTDLKSSVVQLGKALEDPTKGLSALSRSGISFNATQTEMIKKMHETGNAAGAQAEILKILEGQLGGAGAAAGGGLSGALDLVSHGWDKLLVQLASGGAGENVTEMIKQIGSGMNNIANEMDEQHDTSGKMQKVYDDRLAITIRINAEEALGDRGSKLRLNAMKRQREEMNVRIRQLDSVLFKEHMSKQNAEAAAAASKKSLKEEADAVAKKSTAEKIAATTKKEFEKSQASASKFGEKLKLENQQLSDSFFTKEQLENEYFARKMAKINEFRSTNAANDQQADQMTLDAKRTHELKLTDIKAVENEKREKSEAKLSRLKVSAAAGVASNLAILMNTNSKKLFKIGKTAAIAAAMINTYQAITKTMAATPYPWNIPLAAAQGIAGMVQVANIKSQKFSGAREHGGAVIGGRSYLVGERGPEMWTAPDSGRIVNNSNISNAGTTNNLTVNNYVGVSDDHIADVAWNSLLDRMNEEGMRFAA